MEVINTGWVVSSTIRQIMSVPCSGWYLLNRALVSMKKDDNYRFSLSSITLLEREIPMFDKLCWTPLKETFTSGSFFRCLCSLELICGLLLVFPITFGITTNLLYAKPKKAEFKSQE